MRVLSLALFGLCLCGARQPVRSKRRAPARRAFNNRPGRERSWRRSVVTYPVHRTLHPRLRPRRGQEALRVGGYPRFVPALKKAPIVGSVELNRQHDSLGTRNPVPTGRTIVVVTDTPMVFAGGEPFTPEPKPVIKSG